MTDDMLPSADFIDVLKQSGEPSHNMKFATPSFRPGLNTTTRVGEKWNIKTDLGMRLGLQCASTGHLVGHATVVGKAVMPFFMVPDSLIRLQHDPETQHRTLLRWALAEYYDGFTPNSIVTMLLLDVDGPPEPAVLLDESELTDDDLRNLLSSSTNGSVHHD